MKILSLILMMTHLVLNPQAALNTQMTQNQTIYEVRNDFDLKGGVLDLSGLKDCVLRFDGGSLNNGVIKVNNILVENGAYRCFKGLSIRGDIKNDYVDVRWFGIEPDNRSIDCTPIIEKYLMPLNKPMIFPRGKFYLSELHVCNEKKDHFAIIGEESYGLGYTTEFYPKENTQRYIIKVGGGKDCFGQSVKGAVERGYNIKIDNIAFRWLEEDAFQKRLDSFMGLKRVDLTNNYDPNVKVDYPRSALILDRVEIGHFGISGGLLADIPLLTLGYIYECYFRDIIMYHNEGRSDLPIIQVINGTSASISATVIDRIMFEAVVGPLIKTYRGSSMAELVVNNFFFEQSAMWTKAVGKTEQLFNEEPSDVLSMSRVPCFDLNGYGTLLVNNLILSNNNATWSNKYDRDNEVKIRELARYGSGFQNYTNLSVSCLYNGGKSRFAYVEGGYAKGTQSLSVERQIGTNVIPLNSGDSPLYLNLQAKGVDVSMKDDVKYENNELVALNNPYFVKNYGYNGIPSRVGEKDVVTSQYNKSILSENGVKLSRNVKRLVMEFYCGAAVGSTVQVKAEYVDADGNVTHTQTGNAQKVASKEDLRRVEIPLNSRYLPGNVRLQVVGYSSQIASVQALTK